MAGLLRIPIPKSIAGAKRFLAQLEQDLASANTYEAIDEIERRAKATKVYWQHIEEIRQQAEEVIIMASYRVGTELIAAPVAKGASEPGTNRGTTRHSEDAASTIAEQVGSKNRGLRVKKLARIPEPELRQAIRSLHDQGLEATVTSSIREAIGGMMRAANAMKSETPVRLPDGKFDVIVMDPPWDMEKIERDVTPYQAAFDYPVMTEEELIAYRSDIEPRVADDCHFFLWTTHKHLPVSFRLLSAWNFNYVCTFVWHKPGGFQPFGLPQYNCEFAVYARRGTPEFTSTKDFPCCFSAPRREHSRKPDVFYDMIRRVTEDHRRADWFTREQRTGYEPIGNEVDKFQGAAE